MKKNLKHERGQALILIVFGIIALFGLTALAIDGNNVFSDRRHAQNAADTAVLAAARAYVRQDPSLEYGDAALDIASANGFDSDETTNWVHVFLPPESGPYIGNTQYIQVTIDSVVKMNFAQIIGIGDITNTVTAVARVVPATYSPIYPGNAAVSLSTACGNSGNIVFGGNADAIFLGGGFDSNAGPGCVAFKYNGSADLTIPSICSAGGDIDTSGHLNFTGSGASTQCPVLDPNAFVKPNIVCASDGSLSGNTFSPGNFSGDFPPGNGTFYLNSGTYCIKNGQLKMTNSDTLIGTHVLFYIEDQGVSIQGGTLQITGPDSGDYKGLTIYMPPTNNDPVLINGGAGTSFSGTLLAPSSQVTLNGGSGSTFVGQIIGDTLNIDGGSGLSVTYDPDNAWIPPVPPVLELVQ